jgi:hypothetical protein
MPFSWKNTDYHSFDWNSVDWELVERIEELVLDGAVDELAQQLKEKPSGYITATGTGSLLILASEAGQLNVVKFLVEQGLDVNEKTDTEVSAVAKAIGNKHIEVANWLMENGADVRDDEDAVVNAVYYRQLDAVRLLARHDANLNFVYGNPKRTPLSYAKNEGFDEIVQFLESRGITPEIMVPVTPEIREIIDYFEEQTTRVATEVHINDANQQVVSIRDFVLRSDGNEPHIIFTAELSKHEMHVPQGYEHLKYAELVMQIPRDWPTPPNGNDSTEYWPWLWLNRIARYSIQEKTWLGPEVNTFSNGSPPEPLDPSTDFCGFLFLTHFPPFTKGFDNKAGHCVNIITMMPLYAEECVLGQTPAGIPELYSRFQAEGIESQLLPGRKNVAL